MPELNQGLLNALTRAINEHSAENGSNTPDYILAGYLYNCLMDFNTAVKSRDKWHGHYITETAETK